MKLSMMKMLLILILTLNVIIDYDDFENRQSDVAEQGDEEEESSKYLESESMYSQTLLV